MQVKTMRIKKLVMFIVSYVLFSEFVLFVLFFFSHWIALLVWLSNFMITLIWSCIQLPQWTTGVSFYTNPLKFPETESKHLWLLCHFLFYSRFCISAPAPVTQAAIYFLKKGIRVVIFIYIILFYHYFPYTRYQSISIADCYLLISVIDNNRTHRKKYRFLSIVKSP